MRWRARGASAALLEPARRAAEAQIDLIRVRKARHDLFVRKLKPKLTPKASLAPDTLLATRKRILEIFESVKPIERDSPLWKFKQAFLSESRDEAPVIEAHSPKKLNAILTEIPQEYTVLDRYERRALSRRKFAIRELDAAANSYLAKNRRTNGYIPALYNRIIILLVVV